MFVLFCFPFFKFIYLLLFFLGIWVLCFISGIPGSFRSNFFPSENDSFTDGCNHRCMTHHTSMVYMGPPGTFNFQGYYVFSQRQQLDYLYNGHEKSVCLFFKFDKQFQMKLSIFRISGQFLYKIWLRKKHSPSVTPPNKKLNGSSLGVP